MESLGRGLVAVRTGTNEVFISWRMLGTDPDDIAFNLYRGSTLLTTSPITAATNYTDNTGSNETYTVRPVINGQEQEASDPASVWEQPYLSIPLQRPAGGTTPDGVSYTYSPNDCSVGDLDGDGEYEVILKWDPSNAKDNSQSGYTGNVYIDAYKLNGTHMWRIDLGKNIRAGAHYTQFIVYDLDSDGKAEVAFKTADGTIDGTGTLIGNATADYRNNGGYILAGPEYLTVFNGETGAAMATTDYLPARGNVSGWGDNYGNRVDRFLAGVGYFDGQRPSLLMTRGYYTRAVLVAWDWRNGQLTERWTFDSDAEGNGAYAGQGNHQLTVADVDEDGKDEVVFGSMAIDDDGTGLYTTGLGHGDAMHVSDLNPDRPGLETWTAHEDVSAYDGNGLWLRDAQTGKKLWGVPASRDIGRALAADIDPRYKGYEVWGATGTLYSVTGQEISAAKPSSANFANWWDGDLQREILDGTTLDKWNYTSGTSERLLTAYQYGAEQNNGTKANPGLSADILGDWREEVIYRHSNNSELLIFTTTTPTEHRFYTFMHDPQYRVSVAWQNVSYNQPPHTSFYVGEGMETPPTPNIALVDNTGGSTPVIYLGASGGDGEVNLSWSVSNVELMNQEIYRDTDADPNGRSRIASVSATTTTFKDTDVTNDTTYYYWIKAKSTDAVTISSNVASATPKVEEEGGGIPSVVLEANVGGSKIALTWEVLNTELSGQEVYRDTDSNPSGRTRIATSIDGSIRSFVDNTVQNGVTYYYWIKATAVDGSVINSNGANATAVVDGNVELPKVELSAMAGDAQIDLNWTVTNIDLRSLEIFRDIDADPNGRVRVASVSIDSRSYIDNTAQNGITYYYWIKATDVNGAVTNSNAGSAILESSSLDGTYLLTARHSEKVLDLNKDCVGNNGNSNLVQHAPNGSNQQLWTISSVDEGYYTIINATCGQALGVKAKSSSAEGANILQWSYAGGSNQQWAISKMDNDYYSIVNRATGLAVSVEGSSTANGANVKQWTYADGMNQQFSLAPANVSTTSAVAKQNDLVMDRKGEGVSAIIYPNPTAEAFLIETKGAFEYIVFDQLSRVVEQGKGKNVVKAGSKLKAGLYIINVQTDENNQQLKLIKK
ncbi:RICIN domain-containing protein [Pontibacter silvestris]|uniref:RICIN domain-containing protein n=2 Tax=Pontibacter silvestris TaxID=2305183 RepID=A0ABW4WYQ5_9BACT|nr:RICIN domain-containing protein [Pontibacter silvestris]